MVANYFKTGSLYITVDYFLLTFVNLWLI